MALRYIILVGKGATKIGKEHEARLRRCGLSLAFTSGNCLIWVSSHSETVPFESNAGIVLGTIFCGFAPARRVLSLGFREESEVLRSHGRHLTEAYWGGYVAVLASDDTCEVIRDPSGAMPCFEMPENSESVRVLFSDMETLRGCGFKAGKIDWEALNEYLIAYDLRTERTILKSVTEVPSGTTVSFRAQHRHAETYWLPETFAKVVLDLPSIDLANILRERIIGVISAWANVFEKPLLGVSGGLDSSIVAAVLAKASPSFAGVTMATDEADGDERKYVRALGEYLGIRIPERFHRSDEVDVTTSLSGHLPRPLLMAFGQSELKQKLDIARDVGADCFFSGVGGDNVFCNIHSASPLLDRLIAEGLGPGLWETLNDIGGLTGASHFEIIWSAARRVLSRNQRPWFTNTLFLSPEACVVATRPRDHPWLNTQRDIGPGKRAHIAMLARIQGTLDGYSRMSVPPLINPLLSQPIMEFCLSVPTWMWIADGQNRSLARNAFSAWLPEMLVARTSKGTPNSFAYEVVDRNRQTLRDHLIGGLIAAQGLLDIAAIDAVLQPDRPLKGFDHMRLSLLAEAESWARLQT